MPKRPTLGNSIDWVIFEQQPRKRCPSNWCVRVWKTGQHFSALSQKTHRNKTTPGTEPQWSQKKPLFFVGSFLLQTWLLIGKFYWIMQNFSNFLNQIENKRPCHGFNSTNNQHADVGSTTKHNDTNTIHTNDNQLANAYENSSSNLTNSNGLYALCSLSRSFSTPFLCWFSPLIFVCCILSTQQRKTRLRQRRKNNNNNVANWWRYS